MSTARVFLASALASAALFAEPARAWYGPICYTDRTRELALTVPSVAGETAGDVRVSFDDNDGEIERFEARASRTVKNAHEVVLIRGPESPIGVVGVIITSPRSTTGYKFEIDFQKDPSLCTGAIVRSSDRPEAPVRLASSQPQRQGHGMTRKEAPMLARREAPPGAAAPAAVPAVVSSDAGSESAGTEPPASEAPGSAAPEAQASEPTSSSAQPAVTPANPVPSDLGEPAPAAKETSPAAESAPATEFVGDPTADQPKAE